MGLGGGEWTLACIMAKSQMMRNDMEKFCSGLDGVPPDEPNV